jgi:hypothetical protein
MFPEVFNGENKGFDGIVANPPFKGDRDLRGAIGEPAVVVSPQSLRGRRRDPRSLRLLHPAIRSAPWHPGVRSVQ